MLESENSALLQRIRGIAEQAASPQVFDGPGSRHATFLIPLEDLGDEGLNLSITLTGSHLQIKV